MKRHTNMLLTTTAALLLLTGCASDKGLLRSFEDISSDHTKEGFWKIQQRRTMSINGQLPFAQIGDAFHYTPSRGNLCAVGLDWKADKSYEIIHEYATDAVQADLVNIRDKIVEVSAKAAAVIVAGNTVDEAEKLHTAAAAAVAKHTTNTTATVKEKEEKALASAGEARKKAGDELEARNAELKQSTADATKLINKKNLFVFRWNVENKASLQAQFTEGAQARLSREMGRSGFVVLAGMRNRTLHIACADMKKLETNLNQNHRIGATLTDWLPFYHGSRIHLVTHLIETKLETYVSEETLRRAIALTVDVAKIKGTAVMKKAAVELAISSLESLANSGVVAEHTTNRKDVEWPWTNRAKSKSTGAEKMKKLNESGEEWIPLMAVTTKASNLADIFLHKPTQRKATKTTSKPSTVEMPKAPNPNK